MESTETADNISAIWVAETDGESYAFSPVVINENQQHFIITGYVVVTASIKEFLERKPNVQVIVDKETGKKLYQMGDPLT